MRRLRGLAITEAAAKDLMEAQGWLTQPGSGVRAARKLASLRAAILDLQLHPCRWPQAQHAGVRERQVGEYRLAYEVVPDSGDDGTAGDVTVLRVFGPRQQRGDPRQTS